MTPPQCRFPSGRGARSASVGSCHPFSHRTGARASEDGPTGERFRGECVHDRTYERTHAFSWQLSICKPRCCSASQPSIQPSVQPSFRRFRSRHDRTPEKEKKEEKANPASHDSQNSSTSRYLLGARSGEEDGDQICAPRLPLSADATPDVQCAWPVPPTPGGTAGATAAGRVRRTLCTAHARVAGTIPPIVLSD